MFTFHAIEGTLFVEALVTQTTHILQGGPKVGIQLLKVGFRFKKFVVLI